MVVPRWQTDLAGAVGLCLEAQALRVHGVGGGPQADLGSGSVEGPWHPSFPEAGSSPRGIQTWSESEKKTGETEAGCRPHAPQPQQAHVCEVLPVLPSCLEAGMAPTQQAKAGVRVAP